MRCIVKVSHSHYCPRIWNTIEYQQVLGILTCTSPVFASPSSTLSLLTSSSLVIGNFAPMYMQMSLIEVYQIIFLLNIRLEILINQNHQNPEKYFIPGHFLFRENNFSHVKMIVSPVHMIRQLPLAPRENYSG